MHSALMLAAAVSLGWGNAAEIRRIEPNDLLAAAFVAQLTARLGAELSFAQAPEAESLSFWYPQPPAKDAPAILHPSSIDARRDLRYDWRLPIFRTKP
jgi:hypothetical protein